MIAVAVIGTLLIGLGLVWYGLLGMYTLFSRQGLSPGIPSAPDNYRTAAGRAAGVERSRDVLTSQLRVVRQFHPIAAVALLAGVVLIVCASLL